MTDFFNMGTWDGPYELTYCKKALHPSALPGIDYALNPYSGCSHGCTYCYAPEVTHKDWNGWRIPGVKQNIATRLSKEIPPLRGVIGLGTTTDPYQEAERRFELSRQCLEVISRTDMRVSIMTKSDLVIRDIDLIGRIPHIIGITVTHVDDAVRKRTEPGAPSYERRLRAMKELVDAGMGVYGLIGPIMSTLDGHEGRFVDSLVSTGVKAVCLDRLNPRPLLSERLSRAGITQSLSAIERLRELFMDAGIDVSDAFGRGWHEPNVEGK